MGNGLVGGVGTVAVDSGAQGAGSRPRQLRVGLPHNREHGVGPIDVALNGCPAAGLGLFPQVHRPDILGKLRLQLVHLGGKACLEIGHAFGGGPLLFLQLPPVLHHSPKVLIAGTGHPGDSVHTVLAAVGEAGDNIAQSLNLPGPVR